LGVVQRDAGDIQLCRLSGIETAVHKDVGTGLVPDAAEYGTDQAQSQNDNGGRVVILKNTHNINLLRAKEIMDKCSPPKG
jgi:hypothetical protein